MTVPRTRAAPASAATPSAPKARASGSPQRPTQRHVIPESLSIFGDSPIITTDRTPMTLRSEAPPTHGVRKAAHRARLEKDRLGAKLAAPYHTRRESIAEHEPLASLGGRLALVSGFPV